MTTSPYKSKTLNFISEKNRQILDKSDGAIRHLKVAASNTLQLLLYPVYVLLQATRLAVKQLQQTVANSLPQIKGKVNKQSQNHQTVNKPTQPILEKVSETTLEQVSIENDKDRDEKQLSPANIQQPKHTSITTSQIASQSEVFSHLKFEEKSNFIPKLTLESKKMLLAGKDNQKIDPLKLTQQKQLQQNLIPEITNLHQNTQLKLKPCAELAPMFGRIGKFWEVMAWVQISPIALWFNLFGEVSLLAPIHQPKQQPFTDQNPNLLSSSNVTFRNFIQDSAKHYLYPITTGLGLNGLLPPFDVEQFPLDSIPEEEAKESGKMSFTAIDEIQKIPSAVSPSQPPKFQKVAPVTTASVPKNIVATREKSRTSSPSQTTESKPTYQPECLEVKSVSVGYIKHPLEEILAWMDMIISWLEIAVAKLWQWAQKQWQNF
ncbi:MAG: hypothetical protein QNJ68_19455 [Microcoleaceae cyanobacterium MO_207.B10]|nr:hypothetical protein [Microcoleaceae cyanobacterium MO_207.B10]